MLILTPEAELDGKQKLFQTKKNCITIYISSEKENVRKYFTWLEDQASITLLHACE